ncbi:MAG TPA: hypothetical protein VHP33_03555 [Polyangiaceae bacterium]|nr:hypothetical protein [Polyangiaceae bacterium]
MVRAPFATFAALTGLGLLAVLACSTDNPDNSGTAGASGSPPASTGGTAVGQAGSNAPGAGQGGAAGSGTNPTAGTTNVGGTAPATGGSAGAVGMAGSAGTAGSGSGGTSNPGDYPAPPRDIMVTSTEKVDITYQGSTGSFDPKADAGIQKKLVVPMGGVNSGPMRMGWAVQRGFHMLAVPVANGYPSDQYHREYLEAWSGEDLSASITQPPANSVMGRVKSTLTYLKDNDPGSDWGYYLDAAGEVRWNDVIVFGYSYGGQMGVAASKYVALDRVIITASPNVPINAPWLTEMPNKTPVERCYQFVGFKEGEHKTHIDETTKLGWLGEPFDVENGITKPPPYPSHRLIVEDGHSDFCGRPFNDGMKDWDKICEWLFNVQ